MSEDLRNALNALTDELEKRRRRPDPNWGSDYSDDQHENYDLPINDDHHDDDDDYHHDDCHDYDHDGVCDADYDTHDDCHDDDDGGYDGGDDGDYCD